MRIVHCKSVTLTLVVVNTIENYRKKIKFGKEKKNTKNYKKHVNTYEITNIASGSQQIIRVFNNNVSVVFVNMFGYFIEQSFKCLFIGR